MPNAGRFYAPPSTATAVYRERYTRPYSTVSHPMGGASYNANTVAAAPPKGAMAPGAYSQSSVAMRRQVAADSGEYAPYPSAQDSRPRYANDRQWTSTNAYTGKQSTRARAWSEDEEEEQVSVHRGAPLTSPRQFRPMEMGRQPRVASFASSLMYDSAMTMPNRAPFDSMPHTSTLPRLSSLLKRSSTEAEEYESEDRFLTRKRAREASPPKDDYEHQVRTTNHHVYEEDSFSDRRAASQYNAEAWGGETRAQDTMRTVRRDMMNMQVRSSRSYADIAQESAPHPSKTPPLSSARQFEEHSRYPYMTDDIVLPPRSSDHTRRSSAVHRERHSAARQEQYELHTRAYDMQQQRSYYAPETQRNESSPAAVKSPLPTATARDDFSPVRRHSDSKEADYVIEAAADLVEERSPSKRESITKLLLKSKEFLKAKSLVRNRNNEIDWVATFLNVGFESNSIYSLMCPLRKGRWKVEEEKYTMELLRLIESGIIRLRHGQSIRGFIAKKLHSDDMRVLKKLSNCKMFHFARLITPRMSDEEEIDKSIPNVRTSLDRLDKLKAEFLRSVQLEALVAVRKYLSDTSIRDLLNARD
jgi:hypothetical protein